MTYQFITPFRIGPYDCITLDGVAYRTHDRTLVGGHMLARLDDPRIATPFSHAEIRAASKRPGYGVERNALDPIALKARHESGLDRVGDLSQKEQAALLWRYRFCQAFVTMERRRLATRSDRSMTAAFPRIQAELAAEEAIKAARLNARGEPIPPRAGSATPATRRSPSPRTLRRWLSQFETSPRPALALRSRYRMSGDRVTQRFTQEERSLLAEFALRYATETRPTMADIHGLLEAEIVLRNGKRAAGLPPLRVPSYHRVCQELRALPAFEVHAGRHGLAAAMAKFAMVANGVDVTRPLQRVEMDEWKVDLLAICRDARILDRLSDKLKTDIAAVRLWVCAAIDVRTRVVLGMKMGPSPDASLALEVLEMVVSEKKPYADAAGTLWPWDQHGSPETVLHDQAKSFLSIVFRRAVIDLNAEPDSPPAGCAGARGSIERLFKTAGMQALNPFTGRTFGSIDEKGDYEPDDRVSLDVPELCRVLVRWSVDRYHNSPHAGLGGETPANAWRRLVAEHGVFPPPGPHVKRAIFGVRVERVVSAKGVVFLGLFYNCHELQEHRRRHGDVAIDVRIDPMDLGHVSVRLGDAGWFAVPCMRGGLDGVSVDTWRIASASLRRQFAAEARLNDEIVAAAIRDAWDLAAQVQARAGILTTRPTREELDREEQRIGIAFQPPEASPATPREARTPLGDDLTAAAVPVPATTTPPATTPRNGRRSGRTVKFED